MACDVCTVHSSCTLKDRLRCLSNFLVVIWRDLQRRWNAAWAHLNINVSRQDRKLLEGKERGRMGEDSLREDSGKEGERETQGRRFVICSSFHLLPCHAPCQGGGKTLPDVWGGPGEKECTTWKGEDGDKRGKQIEQWCAGSRKRQKKSKIAKEMKETRKETYAYLCIFEMASPELLQLNTGAGRYAKRRMYLCTTRLLFPAFTIHIFARWLTSDKAGDQELSRSPLLPLSSTSDKEEEKQVRHDGSTASAEVVSLANAAAHNRMP